MGVGGNLAEEAFLLALDVLPRAQAATNGVSAAVYGDSATSIGGSTALNGSSAHAATNGVSQHAAINGVGAA